MYHHTFLRNIFIVKGCREGDTVVSDITASCVIVGLNAGCKSYYIAWILHNLVRQCVLHQLDLSCLPAILSSFSCQIDLSNIVINSSELQ